MKTTILFFVLLSSSIFALSHADLISEMLQDHNSIRRDKNIQDLQWSDDLANYAQDWADHLAKNDLRAHSGRDGVGENLARGSAGKYSPTRLFNLWLSEKQYFIEGRNYPDCSTTGSKSAVGHYTQLMWATTTHVGCGFADSKKAVLVCQYSPAGNFRGKPVYSVSGNNPGYDENSSSSSNNNNNSHEDNSYAEEEEESNNNNHQDNSYSEEEEEESNHYSYEEPEDSNNNNNNYNNNNSNSNTNGGGGSNNGGGGSQGGQAGSGGGQPGQPGRN